MSSYKKPDGSFITEPFATYNVGQMVHVELYGANPRNAQTEPFMIIEKLTQSDQWVFYDDDSSWFTKVHWKRSKLLYSIITLEWEIPGDCPVGVYRIKYSGTAKRQKLIPFHSYSRSFQVLRPI